MSVITGADSSVDALRSRFFDAAMRILARDGYHGFKQSTVCAELGLTTGGFYHSFPSWKAFETALIDHWKQAATADVVAALRTIGSPEDRVIAITAAAKALPHRTERALRIWSAQDPDVALAVAEVDRTRQAALAEFINDLVADPAAGARIAAHSLLAMIGYQCSGLSAEDFDAAIAPILAETLALPRKATGAYPLG